MIIYVRGIDGDAWINTELVRYVSVDTQDETCKVWFAHDDWLLVDEPAQALVNRMEPDKRKGTK